MIRCILIFVLLLPGLAFAENFSGYRTTTLDAVIDDWNAKTKTEGPGISFSRPEKIKFTASMREAPVTCSTAMLATVFKMMNFPDALKQMKVTHCVTLTSPGGRVVTSYFQDVLVPGLNSDAGIGRPIEIYADFLAFQVSADRSRNSPVVLLNRFEPK